MFAKLLSSSEVLGMPLANVVDRLVEEVFVPIYFHGIQCCVGGGNRNISLTKECAKKIISPLGCNNPVRGGFCLWGLVVVPISTMPYLR